MDFNLADLFEAVAGAVPDAEAVVCASASGGEAVRLSYRQLNERATRLAQVLVEHDVGAGDHIGLALYNGNEYLEAMLAAFKLRAIPINLNYRYVASELRDVLDDSDVCLVIHEPELTQVVHQATTELPALIVTLERGQFYELALDAASPNATFAPRSGEDLYILYTGGTTGTPKGVVWRHDDLFFGVLGGGRLGPGVIDNPADIAVEAKANGGRPRCVVASPLIHGAAHWLALATLLGGGTVMVVRSAGFAPAAVLELAATEGASMVAIVGDAFAHPLIEALEAGGPGRWDLSSLLAVVSGGALLSPTAKDHLEQLLGGARVINGLGASETGVYARTPAGTPPGDPGRPRFQVDDRTAVLDDDFRPVAPGSGQVGRLAHRGHVPVGYYKDPAKTAETFPVLDGVRWAVPGDMALLEADGAVTLLGRGSTSINTGGEKVYPEEVEGVLKTHPGVLDAVVVGVPHPDWGEQVTAVVCVGPTLRRGSASVLREELSDHCRGRMAGYKLPRRVVVVDEVLRSPAGKPDYRWARETVQASKD